VSIPAAGASFFIVSNSFCTGTNFAVTAESDGNWLSAAPEAGSVSSGGQFPVQLLATVPGPGAYHGTVTVTWPNGSFTVTVLYTK